MIYLNWNLKELKDICYVKKNNYQGFLHQKFNSSSFLNNQTIKDKELPGVPKKYLHFESINISQIAFKVPYVDLLNLSSYL